MYTPARLFELSVFLSLVVTILLALVIADPLCNLA